MSEIVNLGGFQLSISAVSVAGSQAEGAVGGGGGGNVASGVVAGAAGAQILGGEARTGRNLGRRLSQMFQDRMKEKLKANPYRLADSLGIGRSVGLDPLMGAAMASSYDNAIKDNESQYSTLKAYFNDRFAGKETVSVEAKAAKDLIKGSLSLSHRKDDGSSHLRRAWRHFKSATGEWSADNPLYTGRTDLAGSPGWFGGFSPQAQEHAGLMARDHFKHYGMMLGSMGAWLKSQSSWSTQSWKTNFIRKAKMTAGAAMSFFASPLALISFGISALSSLGNQAESIQRLAAQQRSTSVFFDDTVIASGGARDLTMRSISMSAYLAKRAYERKDLEIQFLRNSPVSIIGKGIDAIVDMFIHKPLSGLSPYMARVNMQRGAWNDARTATAPIIRPLEVSLGQHLGSVLDVAYGAVQTAYGALTWAPKIIWSGFTDFSPPTALTRGAQRLTPGNTHRRWVEAEIYRVKNYLLSETAYAYEAMKSSAAVQMSNPLNANLDVMMYDVEWDLQTYYDYRMLDANKSYRQTEARRIHKRGQQTRQYKMWKQMESSLANSNIYSDEGMHV